MDKHSIIQIRAIREEAYKYFIKKSSVYRSFIEMENATFKDGYLSKKVKELIALGISIAINCESCIEYHIEQAFNDGATENELIEAIEVGIEMSGGPGTVSARFAMVVLNHHFN